MQEQMLNYLKKIYVSEDKSIFYTINAFVEAYDENYLDNNLGRQFEKTTEYEDVQALKEFIKWIEKGWANNEN